MPARSAAVEQRHATAQLLRDCVAGHHSGPRRRQFERQRKTLDLAADVDDRARLDGGHEVRRDPARCAKEQARGVKGLQPVEVLLLGARQPVDGLQPLLRRADADARRDHQFQRGAGREQAGKDLLRSRELLDVVEDEQRPAPGQVVHDGIERVLPIETAKESMATLKNATNPPSREQLLSEVALEIQGMAQQRDNPLQGFKPTGPTPGEAVLEELRAVTALVGSKASAEEATAFGAWLLAAAQAAANAAKDGGFMGFHAQQVSDREQAMIDQVRAAVAV